MFYDTDGNTLNSCL